MLAMLFSLGPDLQKLQKWIWTIIAFVYLALVRLKIDLLFCSKASDGLQSSDFSDSVCVWSD